MKLIINEKTEKRDWRYLLLSLVCLVYIVFGYWTVMLTREYNFQIISTIGFSLFIILTILLGILIAGFMISLILFTIGFFSLETTTEQKEYEVDRDKVDKVVKGKTEEISITGGVK